MNEIIPKPETREVAPSLEIYNKLLLFTESLPNASEMYAAYADHDTNPENQYAVTLPEEFQAIISDAPGDFFIVGFEDRRSSYYEPGTQGVEITLSTTKKRYATDEEIKEMVIMLPVDFEAHPTVHIKTSEAINSTFYIKDVTDEPMSPTGNREIVTEKTPEEEIIKTTKISRIDEEKFPFGTRRDEATVRWLRNVEITYQENDTMQTVFNESYITTDNNATATDRAAVQTTFEIHEGGEIGLVTIRVGSVFPSSKPALYESKGLVVHVNEIAPGESQDVAIHQQDPNYAPLWEVNIDEEAFKANIIGRIKQLHTDWNNPKNLLNNSSQIGQTKVLSKK